MIIILIVIKIITKIEGGRRGRPGPSNVHVWALGLSCETPAASRPPGLHTTTRELQTCNLTPPALQTPPKIPREHPQRKTKRAKMVRERKNKRKILDLPPFGAPPFGAHFFWVWPPTLWGLHPSGSQMWNHKTLILAKMSWPKMNWPKMVK